jgi:ppGpp synthetase/RelA/SpoT-type nucleotidyltranferase
VASLASLFEHCVVFDRRKHPSHGYRAVHRVVRADALSVEIQVRTRLQHLWAEFSEKTSDALGSGRLVSMRAYSDNERLEAQNARLDLELELSRTKTPREVVLLEASDEEALRRTHRRYFEDLSQLAESPK